jgi:hypothetical protein
MLLWYSYFRYLKLDGIVKSGKCAFSVIPVKAGIQYYQIVVDSRLRGSDMPTDFLRIHQTLGRLKNGPIDKSAIFCPLSVPVLQSANLRLFFHPV